MKTAQPGDTVTVHYTGKRIDGRVFDSTSGEAPLTVTLGDNDLIEGFEEAIFGMAVGDRKTVVIPAEKAHGEKIENSLIEIDRTDMPEDIELQIGGELEVVGEDEEPFLAVISKIEADTVTLDRNPPLAGETLVIDLQLVAIEQKSENSRSGLPQRFC